MTPRRRVAYHEAGHTVAALALKVKFGRAWLTGQTFDNIDAGVEWQGSGLRMRRATATRFMDVIAAGQVAEALATGERVQRLNGRWNGDLWEAFVTALDAGLPHGVRAIHAHIREREDPVRAILTEHWGAVVAVAEALDCRGELTAGQIRAVARRGA